MTFTPLFCAPWTYLCGLIFMPASTLALYNYMYTYQRTFQASAKQMNKQNLEFQHAFRQKCLYMSQVAHQCRSLTQFLKHEATRSISSPLYGMLVHRRVTPSSKIASTHLYTWVN